MSWAALPSYIDINEKQYSICTDFRDILEIISYLNDETLSNYERIYISLGLFLNDFETLPKHDYAEAYKKMCEFIPCNQENTGHSIKLYDWDQDEQIISAEINKIVGYEIRNVDYVHWWTFIGYFTCIGDGAFANIINIRNKLKRNKKLETWERSYYNQNRQIIDLKHKYTPEENAEIEHLKELLAGR